MLDARERKLDQFGWRGRDIAVDGLSIHWYDTEVPAHVFGPSGRRAPRSSV
jgi:hypothetical protein